MTTAAYLPIVADRYGACVRHIFLVGLDLTDIDMRAQIRLDGDMPGAPLVDLQSVGDGFTEGLRLIDVAADADGMPVSHIQMLINEVTMEGLPYAEEVGDPVQFRWDMQITFAGQKRRLAKGEFEISGDGVTGADNAPVDRPIGTGRSVQPISSPWTSARLTFGEEQVTVSIDGADLLGGLVGASRRQAERAREAADLAALRLASFPDYYQGSPGGDASQIGLFVAIKTLNFDAGINMITTTGRASRGDGGGAAYTRWVSPLPALSEAGRDIWWTEAKDGSRWQIAPAPQHMAAAFGALGGEGIDAGPIINAAFGAPQVQAINIGALRHYFTPTIMVPSGKGLVGVSRAVSWLKAIPLAASGSQPAPRQAIVHMNDVDGRSQDYSLDCSRSGEGRGDPNRLHGLAIYATAGGRCQGTRVRRVDVHNATGYGHYTTAGTPGDGLEVIDVWREDCRVFNCGVGFEATGVIRRSGTRSTTADATPQDAGSKLPCEALYHHYGAMEDFTAYNAVGRGAAQNGLLIVTTDDVNTSGISYIDPDINVSADFGVLIEGRDGRRIKNTQLIGGSIIASTIGAVIRAADVDVRGIRIVGLNGTGLEGGNGANINLHAPAIEANTPSSGTTGAYAVSNQGAVIKWFGAGSLAAYGPPNESYPMSKDGIAFVAGSPQFFPAQGALSFPVTDKIFIFPRSNWTMDFAGSSGSLAKSYWVKLDLGSIRSGGVKDRNKTIISLQPLEFPFPNGSVNNPDYSASVLWIDNTHARIYIMSKADLTDWVLKARVTEFA